MAPLIDQRYRWAPFLCCGVQLQVEGDCVGHMHASSSVPLAVHVPSAAPVP